MFEMDIFSELTELCKQLSSNGSGAYSTKLYDTAQEDKEDLYKIEINGEKVDILTPDGHKKFNNFVESLKLDNNVNVFSDLFNAALDDTLDLVNKKYDEHQKELQAKSHCKCANSYSDCIESCGGKHCCSGDDFALDLSAETRSNFDKIIDSYFKKYPHKLNFDNELEEKSLRNRLMHFLGYVYNV